MKIIKRNDKERIWLWIFILGIFIYSTINSFELGIPCILDDELGYWGNAAYLIGYDWSDVMANMNYYSYGYSLILAIILKLSWSAEVAYKAAIIINALLLSGTFLLLYKMAKRIITVTHYFIHMLICLVIVCYPSYLGFLNVTLCEILLLFLGCLSVYCYMCILDKHKTINYIVFILVIMYMYMVHQRCIGIVGVGMCGVFLAIITAPLNFKEKMQRVVISVFTFGTILCIVYGLTAFFSNAIIYESVNVGNNTYSSEISKMKAILSIDGLMKLLQTCICQFYYMGISGAFLAFLALWNFFESIICFFKKSIHIGKIEVKNKYLLGLYVCCITAVTFFISVISCSSLDRLDQYFYGRYFEFVLAIPFIYGFEMIANKRKYFTLKKISSILILFIIISGCAHFIFNVKAVSDNVYFVSTNVIGIDKYFDGNYNLVKHACEGMFCMLIIFIVFDRNNEKILSIGKVGALVFLIGLFTCNAQPFIDGIKDNNQKSLQWREILEEAYGDETFKVYYLLSENSRSNRGKIQFLLKERKLNCISMDEVKDIPDNSKILVKSSDQPTFIQENEDWKKQLSVQGMELWTNNIFVGTWHYVHETMGTSENRDLNNNINEIVSDGNEGYLVKDQNIGIDPGTYILEVDIEILSSCEKIIGFCELKDSYGVVQETEINIENITEDNCVTIQLDISCDYQTDIDICMFINGGNIVKINNIRYQKSSDVIYVDPKYCRGVFELIQQLKDMGVSEGVTYLASTDEKNYDMSHFEQNYINIMVKDQIDKNSDETLVVSKKAIDIFDYIGDYTVLWCNDSFSILGRDISGRLYADDQNLGRNEWIDIDYFVNSEKGKYSSNNPRYYLPEGMYMVCALCKVQNEGNAELYIQADDINKVINDQMIRDGYIYTWLDTTSNTGNIQIDLLSSVNDNSEIKNVWIKKIDEDIGQMWSEYNVEQLTNEDFVQLLYRILLERDADLDDLNSWKRVLEDGQSRKSVYEIFLNSEEYKEKHQ